MPNWFHRYANRQSELAAGADADLVAENRNRWRRGALVVAFAIAFAWLGNMTKLPANASRLVLLIAGIAGLYGVFLLAWARQESAFLSKPDPEKPPSLLKQD
jgi:hypothetical protein